MRTRLKLIVLILAVSQLMAEPHSAAIGPPPSAPVTATFAGFTVYFLDVGTGDSAIIDHGESEIIVDGGNSPSILSEYLANSKIIDGPVELVVVTHSDADHWKGLSRLLGFDGKNRAPLQVREFWEPGFDRSACRELPSYDEFISNVRKLPKLVFRRPLEFDVPPATKTGVVASHVVEGVPGIVFKVLHSASDPESLGGDCAYKINNASIVLRAEMAGSSFLFTGDANGKRRAELGPGTPAYVEELLLKLAQQHPEALKADVLKAPHHGSETASTQAFIEAVNPCYVIVSASAQHHLPKETVIGRYEANQSVVLRTDRTPLGDSDNIVCRAVSGQPVYCGFERDLGANVVEAVSAETPLSSDNDCGNQDDDEAVSSGTTSSPAKAAAPDGQGGDRSKVALALLVIFLLLLGSGWLFFRNADNALAGRQAEVADIVVRHAEADWFLTRGQINALINRTSEVSTGARGGSSGASRRLIGFRPSVDEVLSEAVSSLIAGSSISKPAGSNQETPPVAPSRRIADQLSDLMVSAPTGRPSLASAFVVVATVVAILFMLSVYSYSSSALADFAPRGLKALNFMPEAVVDEIVGLFTAGGFGVFGSWLLANRNRMRETAATTRPRARVRRDKKSRDSENLLKEH